MTTTTNSRFFAVIPAAGHSRRMGSSDKLLLPTSGVGQPAVIDRVLRAYSETDITAVVLVTRKGNVALQNACRQRWPAVDLLIADDDPEDMKRSIQLGLEHLRDTYRPSDSDGWITSPADLPTLTSSLIGDVMDARGGCDTIVVPRFGGRRGHPVLFPWALAAEVFRLADDEGINILIDHYPVRWLDLPAERRPADLDTPIDYTRLLNGGRS